MVSSKVSTCACIHEGCDVIIPCATHCADTPYLYYKHPSNHPPPYLDLGELIQQTRAMINLFSKAKAAKLIRELVDLYLDADKATGHEVPPTHIFLQKSVSVNNFECHNFNQSQDYPISQNIP